MSTELNLKKENDAILETIMRDYLSLKGKRDSLDKHIKQMRDNLLPMVRHEGDYVTAGMFEARVQDSVRESFSLKSARESLPKRVLSQLSPFIKETAVATLKVSVDRTKLGE